MDEKVIGILAAAAGVAPTLAAELATTDEGIADLQAKVTAKLADVKRNASARGLKIATDALVAAGADATAFEEGREFKDNVAAALEGIQAKAASTAGGDLPEEQLLKLPAVVALKNRLTLETEQKVQTARKEAADSLKQERADFEKAQTMVGVRAWAEKQVTALDPNFSTNAEIATAQREDLIEKIISAGTYQKQGDGYVLLDKDGEIRKDTSENPLKPEEEARKLATRFYGLPVAGKREIPAAGRTGDAEGAIKTKEDFDAAVVKAQANPEALEKLLADYPDFSK